MKREKILLMLLIIMLAIIPSANAVTKLGHITLLAVYEENGKFTGSPADVQLEIKEGTGRVFLETIPLAKVDTQISTRFAKEMACSFAEADCDKYDFFYTIKSPAGIVGGPSAGAAISTLTVIMLNEYEMDQQTAITGTINSGEVIGPVGGLKEKVDAAKQVGMKKVLIPSAEPISTDNITSIIEYGKQEGIEVIPIATLSEAVTQLSGVQFAEDDREIAVPDGYTLLMKQVSQQLCERSDALIKEVPAFEKAKEMKEFKISWIRIYQDALNLTEKGENAFNQGNHYSAASYCFGANIKLQTLIHEFDAQSEEETATEIIYTKTNIEDFDKMTEERKKETITDLQTYMIVKERVLEARKMLAEGNDSATIAYSLERLNSAEAWSTFFGQEGTTYALDDASLQKSCGEILGEVQERFQYLNLFFPGLLSNLKNNLMLAQKYSDEGNYGLCIYVAKRTKAEADIMVSLLGVSDEGAKTLQQEKLNAARKAINKQIDKGTFPIIAYSYYEYARTLQEENNYASILYAEYALELSDIDIYFEKTKTFDADTITTTLKNYAPTLLFIWGVFIGYLLCIVVKRAMSDDAGQRKTQKILKKSPHIIKPTTRTRIRLKP